MKFLDNVDEMEFNKFVKENSSNFMQTSYYGRINKTKGFNYHLTGLKENDKLIASALILEKKLIGKYTYLYIPRGFIIDLNNKDLITTFINHLKSFGKKKHAIYICIDPEEVISIDGKKKDIILLNILKNLGFKHLGFNYFFENNQPRFTYQLDLNDDLFNNFHPTTKKIYNRGNIFDIEIYKGTENDIKKFHDLMLETANRNNATFFSLNYYKNFYKIFKENNMSDIYLAKADINKVKNYYVNEINTMKTNLDKMKNKNKIADLNEKLKKYEKEYNEVLEIKDDKVILSAIITVKFNDLVWTVHGGNSTKLRFLNSNYWLYFKIIDDALKDGFKKIDFFGAIGKEDKNNHEYGIHLFKKRLGGNLIEYVGEFDLILNKFMYMLYKKYIKFRYRKKITK